jgi:hypothetical protein
LEGIVRAANPAMVFGQGGCSLATASPETAKLVKGA